MEERDPGLARERTALAWTRTAISVAALGGAMLKTNPPAGIVVLAMSEIGTNGLKERRGAAVKVGSPAVPVR
jgi:uncharacterized membrane protein YidH (DUF202 family)